MRQNPIPLSPDAYSGMGVHNSAVHRKEVVECFERLMKEVIPQFGPKIAREMPVGKHILECF